MQDENYDIQNGDEHDQLVGASRDERSTSQSREHEPAGGRVTPPAKSQRSGKRRGKGQMMGDCRGTVMLVPPTTSGANERCVVPSGPSRAIACRIDALVIAYQVAVPMALRDEFDERQAICALARDVEIRLGVFRFSMVRSRSINRFTIENHDCRVLYDRDAKGEWSVEVVLRASFLATHTLDACIGYSNTVAAAFGDVLADRLRRCDLAADFLGFPLRRWDAERLATKRARVTEFLTDAKDSDEADLRLLEHLSASCVVTGLTVAPGNDLMARIYDKTAELTLPGNEEKRAIEEELWRRGGWQPGDPVTRVEFQLRGEVLDSLRLRNPADLHSRMDSAWQYCVQRWLRLVDPVRTRRWRCPLDERWKAVVGVVFHHPDEPATRRRVRGGATVEQALGASMSRLGAIGKLPLMPKGDERTFIDSMGPGQQEAWLKSTIQAVAGAQAADAYEQLILKHGAHDAAMRVLLKLNEKRARFWSVDDLTDEFLDGSNLGSRASDGTDSKCLGAETVLP